MSRMLPLKPPPALPPRNDPFRYGWRYVLRGTAPNGQELWDQVPLTLDDVLHPEVGDFIVNSTAHAPIASIWQMSSNRAASGIRAGRPWCCPTRG